jgi:type I restriction enzyme, S subunit
MQAPPLPATWAAAPLGDLAELTHGRALPQARRAAGSVAVYGSGGVIGEHAHALHDGPSVVIGRTGNAGKVFYVPGPFWCIDTALYVERLAPGVNPEFLALVLEGAKLERLAAGTGVPSVRRADLLRIVVPVPPAEEQARIVQTLRAVEALRTRDEAAAAYAASAGAALFVARFGDPAANPHRWRVVKLQNLLDESRGIQSGPPADLLQAAGPAGDVPVWGLENVGEGTFLDHPEAFVPKDHFRRALEKFDVREGDVLVGRAGKTGRIAVARFGGGPACLGARVTRMSFIPDRIVPEYFVALVTAFGDRVGGLRGSAGSYAFLRETGLQRISIPLPPLELQERFRNELARLDDIARRRRTIRAQLDELRAAALAAAATGELTAPWRARYPASAAGIATRDEALRAWTLAQEKPIEGIEVPATLSPPDRRVHLRTALSKPQRRLLEWIEATDGYVTAAGLAERATELAERELTVSLLRQGLALLEQTGMVQRVSIARQEAGPAAGYVAAYRRLDLASAEPRDRADDTLLAPENRA